MLTEERRLGADLCFLGIGSIHPKVGITIFDVEEAVVKKPSIEMV